MPFCWRRATSKFAHISRRPLIDKSACQLLVNIIIACASLLQKIFA